MSRIKMLILDIEDLIRSGVDFKEIADSVGCPLSWVEDIAFNIAYEDIDESSYAEYGSET